MNKPTARLRREDKPTGDSCRQVGRETCCRCPTSERDGRR